MSGSPGAYKRFAKFLLFIGAAVTLAAIAIFQWNLLKAHASEEKFLAERLHNSDKNSVTQFKAAYSELKELKDRLNTLQPPAQNPPSPRISNQTLMAQSLNDLEAVASNSQNLAAEDAHEQIARIAFYFFVVGALFSLFGALWELVVLFKEDGNAKVVEAVTLALGTLLKVLAEFYIPVVFGSLAIFQMTGRFKIDWTVILLVLLAVFPQLLPLLAKYVTKISISLKGLDITTTKESSVFVGASEFASRTSAEGEDQTDSSTTGPDGGARTAPVATAVAATKQVLGLDEPSENFGPQARKILKTLWHYQNAHFPNDPGNRWCFAVGVGAPDYMAFSLGLLELIKADLVGIDPNGLAFLNNRGMEYCDAFKEEVLSYPEMYERFAGLK